MISEFLKFIFGDVSIAIYAIEELEHEKGDRRKTRKALQRHLFPG
jgi:hypothetical protein